jgi:hypothetical protein
MPEPPDALEEAIPERGSHQENERADHGYKMYSAPARRLGNARAGANARRRLISVWCGL